MMGWLAKKPISQNETLDHQVNLLAAIRKAGFQIASDSCANRQ